MIICLYGCYKGNKCCFQCREYTCTTRIVHYKYSCLSCKHSNKEDIIYSLLIDE